VDHPQLVHEAEVLVDRADPSAQTTQSAWAKRLHLPPEHHDTAVGRAKAAVEQADEAALAGAARADQPDPLPRRDPQVDRVERGQIPVANGGSLELADKGVLARRQS
jgi:hypothetical protein